MRRRARAAPGDAVRLLHESHRDADREGGLGRGREIGSRHAAARAVTEDERRPRLGGRVQVDARGAVRRLDVEHGSVG